ncbi:hypothetical protein EYB26_003960 [Talaromyces marneffei]|uniref:uncharacterized protein n=1 Tax=Talaromyces marneffei TaxID=37727 RepID=UPI0012AAB97B|nr:uncharacterized protein EYB26_003960 [Talaromyces marneffei]QGA16293.1 hypothetical protein EYB26_003960 [Talaromyces marneffei]
MPWTVANFIALAVVFMLLATVSVALRFWARTNSEARFGVDDALIIPAAICVVGMAVTMIVGTQIGEMAQHQTNEYDSNGPVYTQTLANYEKCNYILQLLPLASLGFSKTSVLCFYRRIFFINSRFLIWNTALMVIVVLWAVSFFFATAFQCRDPTILWTTFEYARTNCVETIPFYYAVSISGFITDIMILASPLPIIYRLQLPLTNRIAIAGIFLLGAIVCGAGIGRFVTFVNIGHGIFANINDITYFTTPVFAWTIIESSLAVVGANLPVFRPLLLRMRAYTSQFSSPPWSRIPLFSTRFSRSSRGFSLHEVYESDPPIRLLGTSISNQDPPLKKQDTSHQNEQTEPPSVDRGLDNPVHENTVT